MSDELQNGRGMSPATAQRLEYAIIGIGMLALLMIFQPFSIALFTAGSILVVLAGLIGYLTLIVMALALAGGLGLVVALA